jgi:hypothetical protein
MRRTVFVRLLALAACVACASVAASAQQPAPRTRRGGLDNLSLPSRARASAPTSEASADASGWQLVAPEGESFSVRMPGAPERRIEAGRGAGGRGYRIEADGILYEVICTSPFPAAFYELSNFERDFLDSLPDALEVGAGREWPQMRLRFAGAQPLTLGGYDGRAVELSSAEYRSSVRAFVVNRSLFLAAMTGRKSAFSDEKLGEFFGSLRLN